MFRLLSWSLVSFFKQMSQVQLNSLHTVHNAKTHLHAMRVCQNALFDPDYFWEKPIFDITRKWLVRTGYWKRIFSRNRLISKNLVSYLIFDRGMKSGKKGSQAEERERERGKKRRRTNILLTYLEHHWKLMKMPLKRKISRDNYILLEQNTMQAKRIN